MDGLLEGGVNSSKHLRGNRGEGKKGGGSGKKGISEGNPLRLFPIEMFRSSLKSNPDSPGGYYFFLGPLPFPPSSAQRLPPWRVYFRLIPFLDPTLSKTSKYLVLFKLHNHIENSIKVPSYVARNMTTWNCSPWNIFDWLSFVPLTGDYWKLFIYYWEIEKKFRYLNLLSIAF